MTNDAKNRKLQINKKSSQGNDCLKFIFAQLLKIQFK